jgi:arsenite/tail-anchored protein-transporting ATPase
VVNRRSPADAGELLAARRGQEEAHLDVVRREVPQVPLHEVPLLADDLVGEEGLARLAALL